MKNYGTKKERSKTITGFLRKTTGKDIHHYQIGILILIITIPLIVINGYSQIDNILFAIGISLIIDQTIPMFNKKKNYFHKTQLVISIISHIILAIILIILLTLSWFLPRIGYTLYQQWDQGSSWIREKTYIVFVQTEER